MVEHYWIARKGLYMYSIWLESAGILCNLGGCVRLSKGFGSRCIQVGLPSSARNHGWGAYVQCEVCEWSIRLFEVAGRVLICSPSAQYYIACYWCLRSKVVANVKQYECLWEGRSLKMGLGFGILLGWGPPLPQRQPPHCLPTLCGLVTRWRWFVYRRQWVDGQ